MLRINIVYVSVFSTQPCQFCLGKKIIDHNLYFNGLNCYEIIHLKLCLCFSSGFLAAGFYYTESFNPGNFMVLSKLL